MYCPMVSLPDLLDWVSNVILESPRQIVLGDFNAHAEVLDDDSSGFYGSMTTMRLPQVLLDSKHRDHMLDMGLCLVQNISALKMGNVLLPCGQMTI